MSTSQGIALGLMAWQVLLISQSYPWPSLMLVSLTLMGSTGIFIPRPICLPKIIQGLAWGILGVVIFSDAWHATLDPILSTFRVFSAHWMHAISLWLFGIQSISLWSWSSLGPNDLLLRIRFTRLWSRSTADPTRFSGGGRTCFRIMESVILSQRDVAI